MDADMAQVLRELADGLDLVAKAVRRMGEVSVQAAQSMPGIPDGGVCGAIRVTTDHAVTESSVFYKYPCVIDASFTAHGHLHQDKDGDKWAVGGVTLCGAVGFHGGRYRCVLHAGHNQKVHMDQDGDKFITDN
jgi:hypothetical protein